MLFDSVEDVVFGELLGFASIFDFPGLNTAQQMDQNFKFWVCPF